MPAAAANVTAPTLAMTGELDPGSTPAMSHALANAVPGGQAVVLAGLHHLPPIEAPGAFLRPFLDFLDQEHTA
jgi:pimeloyl-ACP methyl ester carboxylesterase